MCILKLARIKQKTTTFNMQKIIDKLLVKYKIQEIESAFVQFFVGLNNINVKSNTLIINILLESSQNLENIKLEIKSSITELNYYDLINIFELLIPRKDRKLNGAFFTPKLITEFIVSNTIKSKEHKICDPSCGCGAFLVESADFINKKFGKSIIEIIEQNLFGVDIVDYSTKRAKILLSLLALQNKEDKKDISFNIKTADSLNSDWNKIFPKNILNIGFDVVVGNPPYVKFQDLDLKIRKDLNKNWVTLKKGNYNLYFAFFELGIKILNEKGILGYITPNNYFTSLAGVHLREFLNRNTLIEKIVDFNHLKVFNAQTYTCITLLTKGKKDNFFYERIDEYDGLSNLNNLKYSSINYSYLNDKKWRLLRTNDQKNIKKIETIGNKLGNIVDIRVGVATCKDSVYFIDGNNIKGNLFQKEYNGKKYLIETEITKPIVKISDFKNQVALDDNKRRIIFPYKKNNGNVKIISENELNKLYPQCYKYLLAAKEELATRDKGKVEYPEWFAYARTQGLNFSEEKLFTPTFSAEPRFLLENDAESMFCNGYAIFLRKKADLFSLNSKLELPVLAKILNSKIMDYYIKRTSVSIEGGFPCYQKNFIELLGIPDFLDKEIDFLKKEKNQKKINDFLIKKYEIII